MPILCNELGIHLSKSEYKLNVRPLLRIIFSRFFGDFSGFVSMCVEHVPSPRVGAAVKIAHTYTGPLNSDIARDMIACRAESPHLMVHTTKLYPDEDAVSFHAFGRVLSGRLEAGQDVRVLGEAYSLSDEEDSRPAVVGRLWVLCGR